MVWRDALIALSAGKQVRLPEWRKSDSFLFAEHGVLKCRGRGMGGNADYNYFYVVQLLRFADDGDWEVVEG